MDKVYEYLLLAFEEAEKAKTEGTFPIGAILVDDEGVVIGRGRNRVFSNCDTTAHAEVDLLRNTSDKLLDIGKKQFRKNNFTMYSTCEPCPMCTGTILLSNIKNVVWAANDDEAGAIRKMKEGPHFLSWFDQINYIAAPYEDLEKRQGKLMLEFYSSRGFFDTHWHQKYKI